MKYPKDWFLNFEYPNVEIASVPKTEYIHGVGYPSFGAGWVVIHPIPCKEECNDGEEVVDVGASKPLVEITRTKNIEEATYALTFDYWQGDQKEIMYRKLFKIFLSTFKFTK